jgi:hypothetical protein
VLGPLQGTFVPEFLGTGNLYLGYAFVATALISGVPLSQLPAIDEQVASAALQALAQVHMCGVMHGDPDNLLRNCLLQLSPDGGTTSCAGLSATPSTSGGVQARPMGAAW